MKNKKRILMLNYEYPPLGGGAANATYYLLKSFAKFDKNNLEIHLITSSTNESKTELLSDNITIHYLDINKKNNIHYQSYSDLLLYSYKAYQFAQKLKKKHEFSLIHAFFGIPCGYIAMKLGLPFIVSLRGSDVPFYNNRFRLLDSLIFKRLSTTIWKKAIQVIANSNGLRQLALKSSPQEEIQLICNGVDTEEFKPDKNRKSNDLLTLISTGRLIERKGYKYLIEALKNNSQIKLILIGDGNIKNDLIELAKQNHVNVTFVGSVEHDEIKNHLNKADVFVLPSLNEGMSNSILEAMACGLPIIATNVGGSDELIKENGYIVKTASSEELKIAIENYLKKTELIAIHAKKSRLLAEQMSWKNMADKYLNYYHLSL